MSAAALPGPSDQRVLWRIAAVLGLSGAIVLAGLAAAGASPRTVAVGAVAVVVVEVMLLVAALAEPSLLACGFVVASIFSVSWHHFGVPNFASPDRLFFLGTVFSLGLRLLLREQPVRFRFELAHLMLALTAAYAIGSAIAVETLTSRETFFPLIDRFGLVPFVLFALGPMIFATERDRRFLLATLVGVAAYLGVTAVAEGLSIRQLVYPKYILDPGFGYHAGRARGPFAESAINGLALYIGALACGMAVWQWRRRGWRLFAAAAGALCLFGEIFTLQRSVWLGAGAATVIIMLAVPRMRRWLPAAAVGTAVAVGLTLLLVPGLEGRASVRLGEQETVWARQNLNTAALNMFEERPLFGFGWGQYVPRSPDYFEQAGDYPLNTRLGAAHNVFLSNLAELGGIGTLLWVCAILLAIGGAIVRRGPPQLVPWRVTLIGVFVIWFVVSNLTPLSSVFANSILWLWAGAAWAPAGFNGAGAAAGTRASA